MIQRVQTLYLVAAFVCCMVSLMSLLGTFVNEGLTEARMFSLWLTDSHGAHDLRVAPLFCLAIIAATVQLLTIFLYKNRRMQARVCWLAVVPLLLWYMLWAAYGFAGIAGVSGTAVYRPTYACVFPLLSLIFTLMARRGIMADERMVRAADRIR